MRSCKSIATCLVLASWANAENGFFLPHGPVKRLASPDSSHLLYGSGPELWVQNTRTKKRTMLISMGGTLSAAWSPDSSAFYVNDDRASDSELAYIYDTDTLMRVDLAKLILTADPGAARFARGHAYFFVERWEGTQHVAVRLRGHTDEPPATCFDRHYRVSRDGAVEKLSQRAYPVTTKFCDPD